MKRSTLKRGKGLRRVAMPARKVALHRRSIPRGVPRVTPGERRARKLIKMRSAGVCEVCPAEHPGAEWHHRVRRSQGGPWSGSNGLWLCSAMHTWVTCNPRGARAKGWGLESHEDPAAVPVFWRGREWVLLGEDGSITLAPLPETAVAS